MTDLLQSPLADNTTAESNSPDVASRGDLPWAPVLMPTTAAGLAGLGNNRHHLEVESWVYGIFLDGEDCQQPVIIGVFPGGPGSMSSLGKSIQTHPTTPTEIAGATVGNTTSPTTPTTSSTLPASSSATERSHRAYTYLRAKGYSPAQCAGIVGNLIHESNVNPTATNNNAASRDSSYGIAQWNSYGGNTRQASMRRFNSGKNVDTLEHQLDFLDYELKSQPGDTGRAMQKLQNAENDPRAAAIAFCSYERPGGYDTKNNQCVPTTSGYQNRINQSLKLFQEMGGR